MQANGWGDRLTVLKLLRQAATAGGWRATRTEAERRNEPPSEVQQDLVRAALERLTNPEGDRRTRRRRKEQYAAVLQGPMVQPLYESYVEELERFRQSKKSARAVRQIPATELVQAVQFMVANM